MSRRELSKEFLLMKKLIHEYYSKKPLEEPIYIHKREIAVQSLEDGVYIRHLSFPSLAVLYNYILSEKTPIHLYYSSAYYESPSADKMDMKGWLGSDLIFDIDADHYPGCDKILYICISENKVYEEKVSQCPESGEKPLAYSLLSSRCLDRAFTDAKKLYSILKDEFGFKDITIYFSGNRGFHVKVLDEDVWSLTSDERREIATYISLEGFELYRVFPPIGKREPYILLSQREYGLRKRLLKYVVEKNIGVKTGAFIRIPVDELEEIINDLRIAIDAVVTMDISRLSRFGNSINGKSGLIVKKINIDSFNRSVFSEYCPWEGIVRIKPLIDISGLPVFDNVVNLKKGLAFDIDACLGLYLVFKGLARLVNIDRVGVRNV